MRIRLQSPCLGTLISVRLRFYGTLNIILYTYSTGKAKVNATSKAGNTALIWAARNGHLNIVKLLMSFDADINVVNKKGYTALLWATQNEHYEISKKLVESGADINAVIFEGDYAGCLAVTFAYR